VPISAAAVVGEVALPRRPAVAALVVRFK
jgi:hypothetical protein